MRRVCLVATALLLSLPGVGLTLARQDDLPPGRRPNIVVIVADDLGYGELTCQGYTKQIPTPHIDSIAANGIRFTNGYVSCPVCSPTRAGLMTGRYQQRFGHEFNPGPAEEAAEHFGLVRSEVTLAERLKQQGYATGMVGKWHLGFRPEFTPNSRGFDEFFGFLGGAHSYMRPGRGLQAIRRGSQPVVEREYLTDAFGREAVAFVERHKREPFFLYLPFNAVHAPLDAQQRLLGRFAQIPNEKRRTFATMLVAMDDAIGAVLQKLRDEGLEEDTLIFFLSDNGGPTQQTTSRNGPLSGFKGQVLEGGIRIPFLVQWKGHIPAGKTFEKPVIALDIHPTALAAAGTGVPETARLDGVDLLPFVTGQNTGEPHRTLYWRFGQQWAIRKGNWKLLTLRDGKPRLYNLVDDIGEKRDLATEKSELAQDLYTTWKSWDGELMKPRWAKSGKP
jgi:arylsulfatase A-like enzyme